MFCFYLQQIENKVGNWKIDFLLASYTVSLFKTFKGYKCLYAVKHGRNLSII